MFTTLRIFQFYVLFLTVSHSKATSLIISNNEPKNGEKITVFYKGDLAQYDSKIYCIIFNKNFSKPVKTLSLTFKDNEIVTSIVIPDSAVYFTFFVVYKCKIDNNKGEGYGFHVYNGEKPIKYSHLQKGYGNKLNNYFFDGNVNHESAVRTIEKEWLLYPELKETCIPFYLETLIQIPERSLEALEMSKLKLEEYFKKGSDESTILKYAELCYNKNPKGLDSIKNILLIKFPTGICAAEREILLLKKLTDLDSYFIGIENILGGHFTLSDKQIKKLIHLQLTGLLFQKNFDGYENILRNLSKSYPHISMNSFLADQFNSFASLYLQTNQLDLAKINIKESMRFYKSQDSLSVMYGNALDTYAGIIYAQGDLKNAIKNQKKAIELTNLKNFAVNQRFVEYLNEDENYNDIIQISRQIIQCNTTTEVIVSLYENALEKTNEKDLELTAFKNETFEKFKTEVRQEIIKEKAPNFTLFDLNGELNSLNDFKGQILVLDFWATWCRPCLQSFPAMKSLQSELKDENVKFLFISTLENVANSDSVNLTQKIKKLAENKQFSEFLILQDKIDPKTDSYVTSSNYQVQSIPMKFIIDKNGYIRFKSIGFSNEKELKNEIKTIIDFLNEK